MPNFSFTRSALHIQDSYKVVKPADMRAVLAEIRMQVPAEQCLVLMRSDANLISEWESHNLLYNLGVLKDHTAHVDFEYPQKWYYRVGYRVLGLVYRIF